MKSSVVWRAVVTNVTAEGRAWVKAPRYMGEEKLGPVPVHGTVAAGDRVLLVLLGGTGVDMIVLPDWEARFKALEARVAALEP